MDKSVRHFVATAGTLLATLMSAAACAHASQPAAVDSWPVVADADLAQMRGGLDLGTLVANFAIERLVRVNGELVVRTLLVMTDLGRLSVGMLPNVQIAGDLANLIRIGPGNTLAGNVAAAASDAAAQALAAAGLAAGSAATPATSGTSALTSTTNIASGLQAGYGDGLARAVAVATGEDASLRPPAPVSVPAAGTSGAPATAGGSASTLASAPAATAPAGGVPAAAVLPSNMSLTIPIGSSGQVIVVSRLPDANALATSIQNSVQATRIQAETNISVALNSLQALRSSAFADALRQQAIDAARR